MKYLFGLDLQLKFSWKAFIVPVLILFAGCNEDEELKCDQYFLVKDENSNNITTKYYYNKDGVLTSMTFSDQTKTTGLELIYENNKLVEANGEDFFYLKTFSYDDKGRLASILTFTEDDPLTDSLAIEYDEQDHIVKRSFYQGDYGNLELKVYTIGEYTGDNLTRLEFYEQSAFGAGNFVLTTTYLYQLDDKQKPYPAEFYILNMSFGNAIGVNNVTVLEEVPPGGGGSYKHIYKYSYNADGVPQGFSYMEYQASFSYSCTPRYR